MRPKGLVVGRKQLRPLPRIIRERNIIKIKNKNKI
jgi:hypothetical protein